MTIDDERKLIRVTVRDYNVLEVFHDSFGASIHQTESARIVRSQEAMRRCEPTIKRNGKRATEYGWGRPAEAYL